jgi:hypothetical protein
LLLALPFGALLGEGRSFCVESRTLTLRPLVPAFPLLGR